MTGVQSTRSTCPYCGVGCGVIIESQGAHITGVRGDPDHPANFGRLCSKGSTLHLTASPEVHAQTRLLQPMMRLMRGQAPQTVSWDQALNHSADKLADIIRTHGPDALGFYVSGQLLTEDYYVFNKLVKGQIGTNNIDTNSRLCMSSAVAGYKLTLGADAPPTCYDDVNHAGTVFIVGSNTAYAHPVLFRRLEDAKRANPQMKVIFCDPRRTDTAELADLYLPIQPGTDVALFNGLLHLMLWEGWVDTSFIAAHTEGFDALKATVRDYTPAFVSQTCGITPEDLLTAAKWFAQGPTLSLYCQGLNQSTSGTAKNAALINLHLATGQIGKPGAGPFSLTGQPNAMGGREVGGLANLLSAHRDLSNPAHRAEVAQLWGLPGVPAKPGKTAIEMFEAAADGEVKALWIACTNPAQSLPDQSTVRRALERAELVVVQEAFATTATCDWADVLLPATTWGEKDGTVTNSERRISRVRPAVPAPGQTRHDWQIVVDLSNKLQERGIAPNNWNLINWGQTPIDSTPELIWNEHRASTRGRDLDITGLSYALLEQSPQQWPYPENGAPQARLYEDGVFPTPSGKAQFANTVYKPVAEPRESRFPFSLTTGRLRDHWHGMSRTGTLARLFGHVAEPVIQVNPQDLARKGWRDGDLVHVTSKRGSIVVPVQASAEVGMSQAFMAMHWGAEYLSGQSRTGEPLAGVNALTTSAYCPSSKQPELKHAAVKILKAELPWTLLAMAWLPADAVLHAQRALRLLMPSFAFATCVPFGRERQGVLFRAAHHESPAPEPLAQLEALLGLNTPDVLRYADRKAGQQRCMKVARQGDVVKLEGFLLGGDTQSQAWITTLLQEELPAQSYGRLLLLPGAKAPVAVQSQGKAVCTCLNVSQSAIEAHLNALHEQPGLPPSPVACLQSLKDNLQCGTNCGSCVPELQKIIRAVHVPV